LETLFAHLATRVAPSLENIAIEALGFLLVRSPDARTALTALAEVGALSLPSELSSATQATAEDDGGPDTEACVPVLASPPLLPSTSEGSL